MKKGDYKTLAQAQKYHQRRFKYGLEIVSRDEMKILSNWLKNIPIKNMVILDIGTGTGRVVNNLLNYKAKRIYALDQSEAMLNYLREIHKEEIRSGKIQPIMAPSDKIPLNSSSIDFVTAFHLFKHLPDIKPTLMAINKVLKPGGYFIFDILNTNSLIKFNLGTCYALSETQIEYTLNQRGFAVKGIVYIHPLGETIHGIFGKILNTIPKTLETIINIFGLKVGTKIFILAQKNG